MRQRRTTGTKSRLLVRNPDARRSDSGFDYVTGDLGDAESLRSALARCDAVHVSVRGGLTAEEYNRVEHHGTARVAQMAASVGVERLTYVSHTLAAPDATAPDLTAKFHAGQAIAGSGVPHTILRPTYFMEHRPGMSGNSRRSPRPATPPVPHDRGSRLRAHGFPSSQHT